MPLLHLQLLPTRFTKPDLLSLLSSTGGLDRQKVGAIELRAGQATVEVPEGWDTRLVKILDGAQVRERRIRAWIGPTTSTATGSEDHFQRLARLLKLESSAEAQRVVETGRRLSAAEAERTGKSLVDLVIDDLDSGLGGRFIATLVKRNRTLDLPWNRLNVGAPVLLSSSDVSTGERHRGIVCERNARSIRVVLNNEPEDWQAAGGWRIDVSNDEIAVQRQQAALERARRASGDRLTDLRRVLLNERPPRFGEELAALELPATLNESQQQAVRFALSAEDVALIHGPPGTGKTTAVVELIRQAVRRGDKVLACAPSNVAVDNMLERLLALGERAVRLGHPARVLPTLREHTLDYLVDEHHDVHLARKLVKDAWSLFRKASRYTRAKPEPGARRDLRSEARALLADARRLEAQAVEQILDSADILCATTTGLDSEVLGQRQFDLAVVDEACQSVEPGCWLPILRAERIVLAGDHCQLPPTIISREAEAEGLGISMFERLMDLHGGRLARRLTIQYRMHESIMRFSSGEFYEGELVADALVREHTLCDLPDVEANPLTEAPLEFIDTAGAGYDEEAGPDGESRFNREEAALAAKKVTALVEAGVSPSEIAVISPYSAQVRLLREKLDYPGLEVDTVDGFQGREKEAVVISLVRSNPEGEIGFLADVRRMNVAMTRARRKLLMIGDSATLARHPFYARLIDYVEGLAAYRTVWEEPE
jgi:ATP-dependent RNA/DNA helicase IGHMBP2